MQEGSNEGGHRTPEPRSGHQHSAFSILAVSSNGEGHQNLSSFVFLGGKDPSKLCVAPRKHQRRFAPTGPTQADSGDSGMDFSLAQPNPVPSLMLAPQDPDTPGSDAMAGVGQRFS